MIETKFGVSGERRCILYDNADDMQVVSDTGWGPNLITNQGLDLWYTSFPFQRTYIGSGSTPATVSDTQMQSFLAQSVVVGSGNAVRVASISPDWQYSETLSRRFGAGVGTGPVNEIAMGASTNDTGTLIFNRVVLGATINKSAIQVLDVIFRLTIWPPKDDVIGTGGTVSTVGGISYETITRLLNIDAQTGENTYDKIAPIGSGSVWKCYDGDLGLITATTPQGNAANGTGGAGAIVATYTPGDYFILITWDVGLDGWVTSTEEIRTLTGYINHFSWQTQFDATVGGAKIPKDGTEIMDFQWKISWDRKP
jgi:hypothetical protein